MLEDLDAPEALWQRGMFVIQAAARKTSDIREMRNLQHGLGNV